jgi:hypothetical protein
MVKNTIRLALAACAIVAAACVPVDSPVGPDAGDLPMVDAGSPDAVPVDAPPPWEPPDPILPDDPCVILDGMVSVGHEVLYDAHMANYSVRFKDGQGLEASPDIRQTGLLEVENADLDKRETVEKRLGANVLADTGDVPEDLDVRRAIWARGNEVVLQTHERIYSRNHVTDAATSLWRDAGAWTQMRLREAYAGAFAEDVLSADVARIGEALVVTYGLDAGSPNANSHIAVFGPSMTQEADSDFGSSGSRPRLSVRNSDGVLMTFQSHGGANQLNTYRWTLGDDLPPTFVTNPIAALPAGPGIWDVHGAVIEDSPFAPETVTAWMAAAPLATEGTLVVRIENDQGTFTGTQTFAAAPGNLADVAVAVWPRQVSGTIRVVTLRAFSNAGTMTVNNSWVDFDAASGGVVGSASGSTALADAANTVHSIALSFVDRENAYVAVEQTGGTVRKVTYYTLARGAGLIATGIVHNATALATQGAIVSGTPSDTLVSAGAAPLTPAFVEQLISTAGGTTEVDDRALSRNGWIMFAPRTEEVLARSMVGYTGNFLTRSVRPAKGSLITVGDQVTWGGPVSVLSAPVTEPLNAIAACRIDRTQVPNAPAYTDDSVVSAHAGYPRTYDGRNQPFEHDWHTLPEINVFQFAATPGTTFSQGVYQVAVTWEWEDANGIRYRSAPKFFTLDASAAAVREQFTVTFQALSHTERENVNAVIWLTPANGTTLYRIWTEAATDTLGTQSITFDETQIPNYTELTASPYNLTVDQIIARQEVLDQGGVPLTQGVVPGERARVTDFVARAGDRLWSRDPLAGKLARFSIPSREASGFAMHWPLAFALEQPEEQEVTAALEMDGRIVLGSTLGLALLTADGPDATGSGSFGLPTTLRTEIGIADQPQLARTPLGYVFGTADGPRLLTPGLTVEDIGKLVERVYKIDGGVIQAIVYDQIREELVVLGSAGATLRLNTSTGRWGSDPERLGRDLTVTLDGTIYLIRHDGKVLEQVQDAWADGATGYALAVSTPWVRDMARDGTTHSSFRLNSIHVSGEYLGAHDLFFDVYKDFNDATPWGTFQVEAAAITANNTANRGWIYGVRLGGRDSFLAARIVVRDGAEAGQTFRLAQVDVDVLTDKSSAYAELPATHYASKV